ncbi:MAG: hypothetical protein GON13_03775 [Nanoarchaeota archaeon]|nr:hypothetical protein [Nanoarchaeota archaeon]
MALASDILQKVKIGAREMQSSLVQGVGSASEFVRKSPVTSAVSVAGGVLAGVTAVQIVRKTRKKSTKRKTKSKKTTARKTKSKRKKYGGHTKRGWKLDRAKRSKEPHELAYQRRKKKVSKKTKKRVGKIYYTKNGQAYKILRTGQARFIKGGRRKR